MDNDLLKMLMDNAGWFGVMAIWIFTERHAHRENVKYYRGIIDNYREVTRIDVENLKRDVATIITNDTQ